MPDTAILDGTLVDPDHQHTGDPVWDGRAGVRAGVPFLAVRTGGFSDDEPAEAGARHVGRSLAELLDLAREQGRSAA